MVFRFALILVEKKDLFHYEFLLSSHLQDEMTNDENLYPIKENKTY